MVRFVQFIAIAGVALVGALAPAGAERRVAPGNDRYAGLSANDQLLKAANDDRAVGPALAQASPPNPAAEAHSPAQPAVVMPPPAVPPGAAPPSLPVQLAAKDLALLAGFDDNRASAIAEATKKADSQKDRDDLAAVLSGSATPMTPKDLAGEWRCRSLQMSDLGLFIYPFFKCRISGGGDSLALQKTTGSQRTQGKLYRLSEARYLYVGANTVNDDPPIAYGTKPDNDDVAYLVRVGANRLRLEFPRGGDAGFEILELRK
jgi:hypothetical protein